MERVLLQEAEADDTRDLKRQLLVIRQYVGTDQLDRLIQLVLCVQDRDDLCSVGNELRIDMLLIPRTHIPDILGVRLHPVDGRIMACISERLVESPEAAHETLRVHSNRLGEITALRRDSADDRYGALQAVQCRDHAGSLVKCRQSRCQISRETFLGRHFLHTA